MNDLEATEIDAENKDLVIAFGGDYSYLDTASKVINPFQTAFMGINSHVDLEQEYLCETRLTYDDHIGQIKEIVECLNKSGNEDENDYIEQYVRSRISM